MSQESEEEPTESIKDVDAESNEGSEVPSEVSDGVLDAGVEKYQVVYDRTLDDLRLPVDIVEEAQQAWSAFISASETREAAGEALFAAIFDAAPSLQQLFKTARSVIAMRFAAGVNSIFAVAGKPHALKVQVETLGFQHLDIEVTAPRVGIFREAILELLDMELGTRFSEKARLGLTAILNYVGGAYIYIRREYASRIRLIQRSWGIATKKVSAEEEAQAKAAQAAEMDDDLPEEERPNPGRNNVNVENKANDAADREKTGEKPNKKGAVQVPTTFNEMFLFNAAVMGYAESGWFSIILDQIDNMVMNVANSARLQEECDVCFLVLNQYTGQIVLSEFRSVMLASLRSLVPKDWDTEYEVSWNWFWENVERMLKTLLSKPKGQVKALSTFLSNLSEDQTNFLRRDVFRRFFLTAPAGQDYFKQSTTRLFFIADKVFAMTVDMFNSPRSMVEDISALGLRHVGYAIPTELFPPFVSSAVDVVRSITTNDMAESAFRWSLTLVSKILVRTILEGSTIVMKAVNTNSEKALRRAISVAPRGRRAQELLEISVGTQSISPLYWSIESGSHNCAKAMVEDLLTIRADRDNYYYGCDALFTRHPEVIHKLCVDARQLIWPLLDGLIWRSRISVQGQRRVNYYIKHLVQDGEGNFAQALEWLAASKDPRVAVHPVVVLFSDLMWTRVVMYHFLAERLYFAFTLAVFIISQSVFRSTNSQMGETENLVVFICRAFIYLGSMCFLLIRQLRLVIADFRAGDVMRFHGIPVPKYILSAQEVGYIGLLTTLIIMCTQEPIFWCLGNMDGDFPGSGLFTSACPEAVSHLEIYSITACVSMFLYWLLIMNLSIFSMQISAFVLVCGQVMGELLLFLTSLAFLILAFATSVSAISHQLPDFAGIDAAALSLLAISLGLFPSEKFLELKESVWVTLLVVVFVIIVVAFLLNLLVAQLNQAYASVYLDMQGYARLNRAEVIVTTLEGVRLSSWKRFLQSLRLDRPLEFNEGDVGLAGGIQILEPANANPTTVDSVRRFGGSTALSQPWPEEEEAAEEDRFARLEKLIAKVSKDANKTHKKSDRSGVSDAGSSAGASSSVASSRNS